MFGHCTFIFELRNIALDGYLEHIRNDGPSEIYIKIQGH